MAERTEIFPSPNIDESFVPLLVEQMAEENRRGRIIDNQPPDIGLFISIGNPFCRGEEVVELILGAISSESTSALNLMEWVKNWGLVRVNTNKDTINGVLLSPVKKVWGSIPLATAFNAVSIPEPHALALPNDHFVVVVNKQPTTEGTIIAISHLIEELILRETEKKESQPEPLDFLDAVQKVAARGIVLFQAEPNTIVSLFLKNQERAHGRILGKNTPVIRRFLGCCFLPEDKILEKSPRESTTKEIRVVSISGGKRLHLGHGLLLELASAGLSDLVLRNNNTGKRANATVEKLAGERDLSFAQAALLMAKGTPDEIEIFWKTRTGNEASNRSILPVDIFSPLTEENTRVAKSIWGNSLMPLDEHAAISRVGLASLIKAGEATNPGLANAGMVMVDNTILLEGGSPTAHGADWIICQWLIHNFACRQIFFVDSSETTKRSVESMKKTGLGEVSRLNGTGIIIGGEQGSGTKGNVPKLIEILGRIDAQAIRVGFRNILTNDWMLEDCQTGNCNWWVGDKETSVRLVEQFSGLAADWQPRKVLCLTGDGERTNKELIRLTENLRQGNEKASRTLSGFLTNPDLSAWFPRQLLEFLFSHGFVSEMTQDGFTVKKLMPETERIIFDLLTDKKMLVKNPFNLPKKQ